MYTSHMHITTTCYCQDSQMDLWYPHILCYKGDYTNRNEMVELHSTHRLPLKYKIWLQNTNDDTFGKVGQTEENTKMHLI
jgi:hypothetical protein